MTLRALHATPAAPPTEAASEAGDAAWGRDVVCFPWSPRCTYVNPNTKRAYKVWALAAQLLADTECASTTDLEELMISLLPPRARDHVPSDYEALTHVLDYGLSDAQRASFFATTLPWIQRTCVEAPSLFPDGLHLLPRGAAGAVRVTKRQAHALNCLCFFSLLPRRHRYGGKGGAARVEGKDGAAYGELLGYANWGHLFGIGGLNTRHKLLCLLNYLSLAAAEPVALTSTLHVEVLRLYAGVVPDLRDVTAPVGDLSVLADGAIEDAPGTLEVDFANKVLGGGVLGRGCVQEEIRFAIAPELFVARVVCEQLGPNEAVVVNGARLYSKYRGYADTFQFWRRRRAEDALEAGAGGRLLQRQRAGRGRDQLQEPLRRAAAGAPVLPRVGDAGAHEGLRRLPRPHKHRHGRLPDCQACQGPARVR